MKPEVGQAAYIVFCAVIGLASAGLVLSIAVPSIGARAAGSPRARDCLPGVRCLRIPLPSAPAAGFTCWGVEGRRGGK